VPVKQLGRDLYFRDRVDFSILTHLYDPNYRIIDAGANIGLERLQFRHNHPEARNVAIKLDIKNFVLLRRNCGDDSQIELFNLALWSGPATLATPGVNNEAVHTTAAGVGPKVEALSI